MKYGKNQWARISSLLVRKSAKQCKARWYEWIDPSVRKTEWSKEEDEKLLHLAKVMPTQWRTIAPIVGRTPAQCLERYQKLLDEAEAAEKAGQLGLSSYSAEAGPSADDVRRLRPGEIDPDPETKPARPDPVDMDDDEKEMLSEARARLANTQGKKAKRKAREKQLEESRRLAALQKRRELKAAGMDVRVHKKIKGMDYNADIPLERKPTPGVYDTKDELGRQPRSIPFRRTTVQELDGIKPREREEELRKRDLKNSKEKKANNLLAQINQLVNLNKSSSSRKLNLPEPQVGQAELEDIAKLGHQTKASNISNSDISVTSGLIEDYTSMTPSQATPRTSTPAVDTVRLEARNLLALKNIQTPLLGEDDSSLNNLHAGTGFEGATPRNNTLSTPNPLLSQTPGHPGSFATPRGPNTILGSTPSTNSHPLLRDGFGINSASGFNMDEASYKSWRNELKRKMQKGFLQLPSPLNDFEIVLPDESPVDDLEESAAPHTNGTHMLEDAADEELRLKREREIYEASQWKSRVAKNNLPRPSINFNLNQVAELLNLETQSLPEDLKAAKQLINNEMIKVISHDIVTNGTFDLDDAVNPDFQSFAELDPITQEYIEQAQSLINIDTEDIKDISSHPSLESLSYKLPTDLSKLKRTAILNNDLQEQLGSSHGPYIVNFILANIYILLTLF
jgi:pre-mRNA-splicing factor CDC5/CEF1